MKAQKIVKLVTKNRIHAKTGKKMPAVVLYTGQIVKLQAGSGWEVNPSNPEAGSSYECTGLIVEQNSDQQATIIVHWSNNTHNSYYGSELIVQEGSIVKTKKYNTAAFTQIDSRLSPALRTLLQRKTR